ncbi:hypothetical protein K443DRAFT_13969 [Laccaria amethystina LaAM-08-1]|uniref:Unplaced genomic scaffold K443scaffold_416, whole genome shotgun sequence n=1 Tax=Laccaria amethystina LaAM-08-1 TaxID=1095629 RepID=A0A0C9WHX8_9AGAR|nr:hypothetical protein K443DRAFT_13969 [Laccaria amethystina LaAM-08-1]
MCLQNLHKYTNISPITSPKHHMHRHTSPNIIPTITGSPRTLAYSPSCFLSTSDPMHSSTSINPASLFAPFEV